MKLDMSFNYRKLGKTVTAQLFHYRIIVVSLVMLTVGLYATDRITELTQPEVDNAYLKTQLEQLQQVTFDEEAIVRIQSLNNSNIEIKSNFTQRTNPFDE